MNQSVHALREHEVFLRELITLYKQQPVLWQQKHPLYRNRNERAEAFEMLVRRAQEYYSEADEDYVRTKIESMRSSFRKERRKVLMSKKNVKESDEVYKPSLWYYDLLLFTVGEEAEHETTIKNTNAETPLILNNSECGQTVVVKITFWTREQTALLINLYKNYPCLFSTSHPSFKNKRRRNMAIRQLTEKLKEATGKLFLPKDVCRKISLIRGQFLHEFKKSKGENYTPTLWCYEMLNFLKDEYTNKKKLFKKLTTHSHLTEKSKRTNNSSVDINNENLDIKKESDSMVSSEKINLQSMHSKVENDIFDVIGKHLAYKLREMTEDQRKIANKIIRDVMYHGQMEHLSLYSRLSLDGN